MTQSFQTLVAYPMADGNNHGRCDRHDESVHEREERAVSEAEPSLAPQTEESHPAPRRSILECALEGPL